MRRLLTTLGLAAALTFSLAACAPAASTSSAPVTVSDDTVILDVRSPQEYASGHLERAQLLDFNAGDVAAAIPTLDPDAEYLVYCRSGNRAAQAIALMEQAGFTDVTNLGSLNQAASSTGVAVVD